MGETVVDHSTTVEESSSREALCTKARCNTDDDFRAGLCRERA